MGNEPNGDYKANCYLHVGNVNPNDVRFNDANCNHASTAYLCQPKAKPAPVLKCNNGSPKNCAVKDLKVSGLSAGKLLRVDNGFKVSKSTMKNSCPAGYKIWSPRNKNDWTRIYNAMSKKNGCGGCNKFAMKFGL